MESLVYNLQMIGTSSLLPALTQMCIHGFTRALYPPILH